MKSFKQFHEDAYAGRQGAGAWFTGKALELGARGVRKGYQAITSFASLVNDFNKKRKKQIEDRVEQSKVLKGKAKVPDPEADKQRDDAENDPDLEKIFRDENPNVVDFKKRNKPKK